MLCANAQLGWPDMRLPILYTMSWPERVPCSEVTWPRLDFAKASQLTFKTPDRQKYPSMDLAYAAGRCALESHPVPDVFALRFSAEHPCPPQLAPHCPQLTQELFACPDHVALVLSFIWYTPNFFPYGCLGITGYQPSCYPS